MKIINSNFIAITPAKNEAKNLNLLYENLKKTKLPANFHWVIVINGSNDNSIDVVSSFNVTFPIHLVFFDLNRNLATGGAWKAFLYGINWVKTNLEFDINFVMKLDADVTLDSQYFEQLSNAGTDNLGIIGGITLSSGNREQLFSIQGAVKTYSSEFLEILENLPAETGFDVLDEVFARMNGFTVEVIKEARYELARITGSSEGFIEGRIRNGKASKFVGYDPLYFTFHLIRYLFRYPPLLGSFLILYGYLTAPQSPFPSELRREHILEQRKRLRELFNHPVRWLKKTYFVG